MKPAAPVLHRIYPHVRSLRDYLISLTLHTSASGPLQAALEGIQEGHPRQLDQLLSKALVCTCDGTPILGHAVDLSQSSSQHEVSTRRLTCRYPPGM